MSPLASVSPFLPRAAGTSGRDAFLAVFNLRMIAASFYFVLAIVASRAPWFFLYGEGTVLDTVFNLIRHVRQNLISALAILLALAILQALAARRDWSPRTSLLAGLPVLALVSAAAMGVRIGVSSQSYQADELGYYLTVIGLWIVLGSLAGLMFSQLRLEALQVRTLARLRGERDALEAQHCEAQLAALNAQIEPHFLFNTLANVRRLYETSPARGREMLASLIDYLRAALPMMRHQGSTLGRELELVRAFLSILQMRMGPRLAFEIQADEALRNASLPPLVLPTLVENAVKHGLAPLPEGGTVRIGAAAQDGVLRLWVEDDGAGFSGSGGSGVGLANTRARLAALYGERAGLRLSMREPRGVRAEVHLPRIEAA